MRASRVRALLVAEAANPEWVSVPLEGWSLSRQLAEIADVHLVTQRRNVAAILRAGWDPARLTALDSERVAAPLDSLNDWLRKATGLGWTLTTALQALPYYAFESALIRTFGDAIAQRRFDVVHRVTPLSPTIPSLFLAKHCKDNGVPFVWGPVNGGVPWPKQFRDVQHAEGEWLTYVREAHRLLPGHGRTRKSAAALIAGSCSAWEQFAEHRERCVYIPENGVDPARFTERARPFRGGQLRIAFVGRLVPYKAADILIEAAAPLVRQGKVLLDIIGDGPELGRLRALRAQSGVESGVLLDGWVPHEKLAARLASAHVFGFPSLREFGGAVVLEAMATGLVPIVVGYGGPNELVSDATGIRVPLGDRASVVAGVRDGLTRLLSAPELLESYSQRGQARVRRQFTWQAKAAQVLEVYRWVLGARDKPDFGMPLPDERTAEEGAPPGSGTYSKEQETWTPARSTEQS